MCPWWYKLIFHAVMLLVTLPAVWWVRRDPAAVRGLAAVVVVAGIGAVAAFGLSIPDFVTPFYTAQLGCWLLFLYLPLLLLLLVPLVWTRHRPLAALGAVALVGLLALAVDAFLIEPRRLQKTWYHVTTDKLVNPVRIALLADIQTDHVGRYERRALALALEDEPALIVFAGDYVQGKTGERNLELRTEFRELLGELDLEGVPLSVIAVPGNLEGSGWTEMFAIPNVITVTESTTYGRGPLVITGLTLADCRSGSPPIPARKTYHVAVGHAPDFALAGPPADLMLAGHTHGGQVQLPFIGPLMTFTKVPRRWAAGRTDLPDGSVLIVSNGIGMERLDAPRLRFLCPPEVVIIDVVPENY